MVLYHPILFKLFKQRRAALDHITVSLIKASRIPRIGYAPSRAAGIIQQQFYLAFRIRPGDALRISYIGRIRTQQQIVV